MLNNRYVKIEVNDGHLSIEANGPCDEVCGDALTGLAELLEITAKRDGRPDSLEIYFRSASKALMTHLEHIIGNPRKHCTCKAEPQSQPEEPPKKRMTPEEFMAFYNAWMSQASAEERDRFIKLNLETIAERIVKPY